MPTVHLAIRYGEELNLLVRLDAQSLASVHVESACSLAIPIAFRAILFSIAGLAVNLIVMYCYSCAV